MVILITVKVKWGKELYPNVEVNTDEEPMLFKAQLYALTGVQPERQKVMVKGITLKDDDWGNIGLKDVRKMCYSLIHSYLLYSRLYFLIGRYRINDGF